MIESTVRRIRTARARIAADPELAELERRASDEDDAGAAAELLEAVGIPPISGGAPDDDEDDDDDDDDEDDEDDEDDDDDEDDEPISKAEAARLQDKLEQLEKRARKAEKKLADQRREKDEGEGDFERLYKDEKRKNEALEGKIVEGERLSSAEKIARRLKFKNPDHAVRLISEEAMESESSQERALKALAREEPAYVRKAQREPTGNDDDTPGGSSDDDTGGKRDKGEKTFGMDTIRAAYAEKADDGGDED